MGCQCRQLLITHIYLVCKAATSSGHNNYDGSKGGGQMKKSDEVDQRGGQDGWIETQGFHPGDCYNIHLQCETRGQL